MEKERFDEEINESPKGKIMIRILLAVIGIALIAAVILGMNLLNSLNRPGDTPIFEATEDDILITPAPLPTFDATPAPSATPAPTPIPMSEVYEQTWLDPVTISNMEKNKADERYIHVLLIGVDRRSSSGNSNTDTMMIATIDTVHNSLKLTTIMRDMLVNIPGVGYGKMNSAAVRGGTELLFETINSNFCLDLTEYVLVDFSMFERIVDEIGGVTVKMTAEEISETNDCIAGLNKQRGIADTWDGFVFAEAGNVKLTGKQALGYARVRKIDSDFSRTERQYKLLNNIYAKFRSLDAAKQYKLIEDILPMVETNMTNQRIIDCAAKVLGMDVGGMLYCRIPAEDTYESAKYERKSVVLADMPANAALLHQFIFLSAEEAEEAQVLKPGASLPPRTPTIYQGPDGNYYYYSNNMPAYTVTPDPFE
ncbi:MAG: LCP family protein [Clostridia bacterium]|nr:LCP family protein [Clostridia bacterium]